MALRFDPQLGRFVEDNEAWETRMGDAYTAYNPGAAAGPWASRAAGQRAYAPLSPTNVPLTPPSYYDTRRQATDNYTPPPSYVVDSRENMIGPGDPGYPEGGWGGSPTGGTLSGDDWSSPSYVTDSRADMGMGSYAPTPAYLGAERNKRLSSQNAREQTAAKYNTVRSLIGPGQ